MYNVLLVDDERHVRQGLKLKIDWEQFGFTVVAEASNGEEALTAIAMHQPHVVITDIRMPIMDGVALLEACSKQYPDIHFIVLSGYEEFNYVKAALQFGASDYLLKPVVRKELAQLLEQLQQQLLIKERQRASEQHFQYERAQHIQRLREQFWLQAVRGHELNTSLLEEGKRLELEAMLQPTTTFYFVTIEVIDQRHNSRSGQADTLLVMATYLLAIELLATWHEHTYVFRDPAMPSLLFFAIYLDDQPLETALDWLYAELAPQLEHVLQISLKIGTSNVVQGTAEWKKAFAQSRMKWLQLDQPTTVTARLKHVDLPATLEKQLTAAMLEHNQLGAETVLQQLLATIEPLSLHEQSGQLLRLLLLFDSFAVKHGLELDESHYYMSSLPESIWQLQVSGESYPLFATFIKQLIEQLQQKQKNTTTLTMEQVAAYLEEHYADENISLSQLAAHFHLHTTYLSELFKKTIGVNYRDYLTTIRINKAKELLQQSQIRITTVAELTGFTNANYFSHVFKKLVGISPLEFQQAVDKLPRSTEKIVDD